MLLCWLKVCRSENTLNISSSCVSKLVTEAHSDMWIFRLFQLIHVSAQASGDSWFGPQRLTWLAEFSYGGKTTAEERSCLACNDMPWDYSVLFTNRDSIPLLVSWVTKSIQQKDHYDSVKVVFKFGIQLHKLATL